jgi:hypothetical protein
MRQQGVMAPKPPKLPTCEAKVESYLASVSLKPECNTRITFFIPCLGWICSLVLLWTSPDQPTPIPNCYPKCLCSIFLDQCLSSKCWNPNCPCICDQSPATPSPPDLELHHQLSIKLKEDRSTIWQKQDKEII